MRLVGARLDRPRRGLGRPVRGSVRGRAIDALPSVELPSFALPSLPTGSGTPGVDAAAGLTIDPPYTLSPMPAALQQLLETQMAASLSGAGGQLQVGFRQVGRRHRDPDPHGDRFPAGILNATAYQAALAGMGTSMGAAFTTTTVDRGRRRERQRVDRWRQGLPCRRPHARRHLATGGRGAADRQRADQREQLAGRTRRRLSVARGGAEVLLLDHPAGAVEGPPAPDLAAAVEGARAHDRAVLPEELPWPVHLAREMERRGASSTPSA